MKLLLAALLYFFIVFGVGFVVGPIRVIWLEPRLGKPVAVLCELPLLLAAMILAARWVPRRVRLDANLRSLASMGILALAFQQIADFVVGIGLRGITPSEQFASFPTPAGLVYAAALLAFAAMPALANHGPSSG